MRSGARVITQRSTVQPWAVATLSKVRRNASGSSVGFILGSITDVCLHLRCLPAFICLHSSACTYCFCKCLSVLIGSTSKCCIQYTRVTTVVKYSIIFSLAVCLD
ncbi:hypothetical protein FKM82_027969 [Ascaphus truei]